MTELRFSLGSRDTEILDALTLRVRLLSITQIARTWWGETAHPGAGATARLRLLEQAGLIARFTAMARPELDLALPVISWKPGEETPDLGAASYRLQSRFRAPIQRTLCVIATERAGAQFGGKGGRYPKKTEQTHDLHMAALFLLYRREEPGLIPFWVSEETIKRSRPKKKGEKLPDAMIVTPDFRRVVEFGGEYGKEKLSEFHAYCSGLSLPYEVW